MPPFRRPLLFVALLTAAPAALADTAPARPGLWEQTRVIDGGKPEKDFACVTQQDLAGMDDWKKELAGDCKIQTLKEISAERSYDYSCGSAPQPGKGHVEIVFDSPTRNRAQFRFEGQFTAGGKTIPMKTDIRVDSRWVAADCGEHAEEEDEGQAPVEE